MPDLPGKCRTRKRPENDGPNRKGWKMQDLEMLDQITGVENAGLENDGPRND